MRNEMPLHSEADPPVMGDTCSIEGNYTAFPRERNAPQREIWGGAPRLGTRAALRARPRAMTREPRRTLAIHLDGTFHCTREALKDKFKFKAEMDDEARRAIGDDAGGERKCRVRQRRGAAPAGAMQREQRRFLRSRAGPAARGGDAVRTAGP